MSSSSRFARLVLGFVCLVASGCVHSVAVRGAVLLPARIPVRSFPSIWVSGGALEDEQYLQDRLANHLAEDGQREVRRVELGELEPARKAGTIPASTVVVLVQLSTETSEQTEWASSPGQVCTFYGGCYLQYQSYPVSVPEVHGEVVVTVYEGPTAKVLQREIVRRMVVGDDSDQGVNQLLDQLALALDHAVDVLRMHQRLSLYVVDVPGVKEAVEQARQGHWDAARATLEGTKDQLSALKTKNQARFWYDLGLARWFAPGPEGLTQKAYVPAKQALDMANKLDAKPIYARALKRLDEARTGYSEIEKQRRAAAFNFALQRDQALKAHPVLPAQAAPAPEQPPSSSEFTP